MKSLSFRHVGLRSQSELLWCPHGEEDDAACTLGASVAQVVRDRIAHAWFERPRCYRRRCIQAPDGP